MYLQMCQCFRCCVHKRWALLTISAQAVSLPSSLTTATSPGNDHPTPAAATSTATSAKIGDSAEDRVDPNDGTLEAVVGRSEQIRRLNTLMRKTKHTHVEVKKKNVNVGVDKNVVHEER